MHTICDLKVVARDLLPFRGLLQLGTRLVSAQRHCRLSFAFVICRATASLISLPYRSFACVSSVVCERLIAISICSGSV